MRIAMFSNHYYPHVSGVAVSIASLREELALLGHETILFTARFQNAPADTDKSIVRVPAIRTISAWVPFAVPWSRIIRKELDAFAPDIIHTHHPILLGKRALREARKRRIPIVATKHALYEYYADYVPLVPRFVIRPAVNAAFNSFLRRCDGVIAPSGSVEGMLRDARVRNTVVAPTGIDPVRYENAGAGRGRWRARLGLADSDIAVMSMGRLQKEKNFPLLLEAVKKARSLSNRNIRLFVAGTGAEKSALENTARKIFAGGEAKFVGLVEHKEVPAFFAAGDIFSYASVTETQGLTTLEAMAAGLPVAAVAGPGTSDMVEDGISGILAENDPEKLGEAIASLANDPEKAARLARAAKERSNAFTARAMAQKILGFYAEAVGASK